jgi:peroxiredoxin
VSVRRIRAAAVVVLVAASLVLAGCSSGDGIAGSYTGGDYTSGDGTTHVIAPASRTAPISFTATTATGGTVSSSELRGDVVVVNFWYAQCAPCIAEAPRLEKLYAHFGSGAKGVQFLGVDINDLAPQATAFAKAHGVSYPITIETGNNAPMAAAFAGKFSPRTTPTTLVIDKKGRVAARFDGEITSDQTSVLREVIQDALTEKSS